MRGLICTGIGIVMMATLACGSSDTRPPSEQPPQAPQAPPKDQNKGTAEGAERAVDQTAQGLEQFAKGLEQLAQNVKGSPAQSVTPVSFRDLQVFFPDLEGWQRGKPTGEKMTAPVSFSQAQVTYSRGDSRIDAKIVDSSFHQMLLAPFTMFLSGFEKETERGYEKTIKVGGNPGWEEWDGEGKDGKLHAVVSGRFLVSFEGSNIDDTKVLHHLASKIDLGKLATLK